MSLHLPKIADVQAAAFELLLTLNEMTARAEDGAYVPTPAELRWCRDAARMCYQYQLKCQRPNHP